MYRIPRQVQSVPINDKLKELGVIEFYKKGTVLNIDFTEKRLLQFEIDANSIQKTYQNLEKAADDIDFDAGILKELKRILGINYDEYLKLPKQQEERQQQEAQDSSVRQHNIFKYSTGIPLAEQIKLGEDYVFLQIVDDRPVISPSIDLSKTKKIILYTRENTPILDFQYKNEDEIKQIIEVAKTKTIDDLYFEAKSIWKKFVVATPEQIVLLTTDSIFTFFQDRFETTHYCFIFLFKAKR